MGDVSMLGMTVSGAAGFERYRQESIQAEMNNAVRIQNNQNAMTALTSTYRALDDESTQIAENSVANSIDTQKQAAQMKGTVVADAGAKGVGGTGATDSLRDVDTQASSNMARAAMNRDRQLQQVNQQRVAALTRAQSRVQMMPSTQKPSLWGTAIEAGAQGFRNVTALDRLSDAWSLW